MGAPAHLGLATYDVRWGSVDRSFFEMVDELAFYAPAVAITLVRRSWPAAPAG
ncbi:hypothetical protein [Nonomuraea phyllanthi]|uniref:hypothetical protein n=1 Tax=Nonomuraea phyllanthi TaxID=2219224 RepID=UPI00186B46F7|nr:hypothetical protein [Nonomuraea phyllanthi]